MRYAIRFGIIFVVLAGCRTDRISEPTEANAAKGQNRKVLIVTGIDYPGHKWQLTAPVLAEAIGADKRLEVTTTEEPNDLASDDLGEYDVIVLHFMNWEIPDPGPAARANLKGVIASGKG
ncbi:MAG TPA: hypothetical protein VJJ98_07580, partial [Sedimentisphaerales bacterium]|nr:hypothetical protein [Sedimentisphaerales bacterium]